MLEDHINFSLGIRSCAIAIAELQDLWEAFVTSELEFMTSQLACKEFTLIIVNLCQLHECFIVDQMDYQSTVIGRSCCIDLSEHQMWQVTLFLLESLLDCPCLKSYCVWEDARPVSQEGLSFLASTTRLKVLQQACGLR